MIHIWIMYALYAGKLVFPLPLIGTFATLMHHSVTTPFQTCCLIHPTQSKYKLLMLTSEEAPFRSMEELVHCHLISDYHCWWEG